MANDKKGTGPLEAGVLGAVIGAAAAAAAIALSNEKNRKRAEAILKNLQKDGEKILAEVSKKALELKDKGIKALPKPARPRGGPKKAKKARKK